MKLVKYFKLDFGAQLNHLLETDLDCDANDIEFVESPSGEIVVMGPPNADRKREMCLQLAHALQATCKQYAAAFAID